MPVVASQSRVTVPKRCNDQTVNDIWSRYDTFIFDADGVLWKGERSIPGAPELVSKLTRAGKQVMIMTNNATKPLSGWVEKCAKLGFEGLGSDNIVSSAIVCAHELRKMAMKTKEKCPGKKINGSNKENNDDAKKPCVYLLGPPGLEKTINDAGLDTFGVGPDPMTNYTTDTYLFDVDITRKPFAVVSSMDPHLSYPKIMKAVNYLKDPNIEFVATHEDLTYPGPKPEIIVPAAGTTSSVLRALSGRTPSVMGKPNKAAWTYIKDRLCGQLDPSRTMMIGDRCDTDMVFGNRIIGADTLLVLSGVTTPMELDALVSSAKSSVSAAQCGGNSAALRDQVPVFYTNSVKDLLDVTMNTTR